MKKEKDSLNQHSVNSDTFHVGIELELIIPCEGEKEHDDDACHDSQRQYYADMSDEDILRDYIGVNKETARQLSRYFDSDKWVDDMMDGWSCDDPSECGHSSGSGDGDSTRDDLCDQLKDLTGNTSIKVEDDSSINHSDDETDAEVCWNYYSAKDTLKDNEKILAHLMNETKARMNTSCGLHINLNNYLNVPSDMIIPTSHLDFLFNFVAPSRRKSHHCNAEGISRKKYSMINHRGDRLEFRFFSPTLSAEKLHHYVVLANTIYRRLAGKDAKLPKKTMKYLYNKMTTVNGISPQVASDSLKKVNSLDSITPKPLMTENDIPF